MLTKQKLAAAFKDPDFGDFLAQSEALSDAAANVTPTMFHSALQDLFAKHYAQFFALADLPTILADLALKGALQDKGGVPSFVVEGRAFFPLGGIAQLQAHARVQAVTSLLQAAVPSMAEHLSEMLGHVHNYHLLKQTLQATTSAARPAAYSNLTASVTVPSPVPERLPKKKPPVSSKSSIKVKLDSAKKAWKQVMLLPSSPWGQLYVLRRLINFSNANLW